MNSDDAHGQGRRAPGDTPDQRQSQTPTVEAAGDEAERVAGETVDQIGATTAQFPSEVGATETPEARREPARGSTSKHAFLVGAGILLSRIVGLIRQRVFAYYFGISVAGDAYAAAFRIPNFLQNVFGEGALSASFIPVYARLEAQGEREQANRVAGAVFSILTLVTSTIVLAGVVAAPLLADIIAPGFEGEKRDLTVALARIFFPGAGLLVMSAWCLGVLNSHRRFFLSYTAPVIWNVAIMAALVFAARGARGAPLADLGAWGEVARYTAWGSVVGSALQFGVQLPTVLRLLRGLRLSLAASDQNVRTVARNFVPVFLSRGVVQISAFVDAMIASLLGDGPVQALTYTQSLYTLPVSLFGMAVSAAELPAMSSTVGEQSEVAAQLRKRLDAGLRQISYFIVPSIVGFVVLGDVMVSVLYRTGNFTRDDSLYVWAILAGASVGLLPTTLGRLYASTFYALHDTRTPFRFAALHVALAVVLGYLSAIYVPPALGVEMRWGAVGLTASAGVAGWIEFLLLRRKLNARIGHTGLPASYLLKLFAAALACAAVGWGLKLLSARLHPIFFAATVLLPYGLLYFAVTSLLKVPESRALTGRFLRLFGRGGGGTAPR
jgi:putative peptidoglycan lipid II flippase